MGDISSNELNKKKKMSTDEQNCFTEEPVKENVEIIIKDAWLSNVQKRVEETKLVNWSTQSPTIFKVPRILKETNPSAYEPRIISLGPYHRSDTELQATDNLKWQYLKYFLRRFCNINLDYYLNLIKNMEDDLRRAYSEDLSMIPSNDFILMMLLDGCSVILKILWAYGSATTLWADVKISRDIFMLENQLPFFLLEALFNSAFPHQPDSLSQNILDYINKITGSDLELPSSDSGRFHHILHLYHSCIIVPIDDPTPTQSSTSGLRRKLNKLLRFRKKQRKTQRELTWIPSATLLKQAGIHFKRKKNAKSFLNITFKDGEIEIPQLQMDDHTNTVLRNLIAYEQCSVEAPTYVTSYVHFMDCLIDTAEDVELLQQDDIIISGLGDSDEVATVFNELFKEVVIESEEDYLADICEKISKHRNTSYNKWRAKLNHDYFNSPWALISLVGAIFLFILTAIQTIYTVLGYY
ncbi:hypothetical protein Cni_G27619 [Canna indica]|uniref:Uncharacterized protein n=1 Tax=Canna indica TaxID=4628 RepID=A0AAQ3L147_9LILI|nr:hypothetical protein Cni_G27619 [Canna indica]